MENNTLKSLQGWDNYAKSTNQTNICKYLSIGDIVDEDLVLHFLNISHRFRYAKIFTTFRPLSSGYLPLQPTIKAIYK